MARLEDLAIGGATRPDSFSGMDKEFYAALAALIAAAPPEIQQQLKVNSGFRSIERQKQLWEQSDKSGKMVARPGRSQHNHGRAADLKFLSPKAKEWVHANAAAHGLTFPMSWEPWHIELAGARGGGRRRMETSPTPPTTTSVEPRMLNPQKIVDEEKLLQEQIAQILAEQTPARRAVLPITPVPTTKPIVNNAPTIENAIAQQELVEDFELAEKLKDVSRIEALSDDELAKVIGGFSSTIDPQIAAEEAATRQRLDEQSMLENLVDPAAIERKAGQVVSGAANAVTSGPVALTGLLGKGLELVTQQPLLKNKEGEVVITADDILKTAGEIQQDVNTKVGIGDPRNIGESAANIIGSIAPIPGLAAPTSTLGNIAEIATPLVIGGGGKRVIANFTTALVADQAVREVIDSADDDYKTAFDKLGLTSETNDRSYPALVEALLPAMGIMAGASIITPVVVNKMRLRKAGRQPKLTDVIKLDPYGPLRLKTFETAGDLFKTYAVDEKTVLSSFARRAGVPDPDIIERLIDNDTQMSAVMRINEAMRTGKLRTVGGNYSVNVTPDQLFDQVDRLPAVQKLDADRYVKYKNLTDVLHQNITNNVNVRKSQRLLRQANAAIFQIEQRFPEVKQISKIYQDNTAAVRNYIAQGNGAMLSASELQRLGIERPNYVPISRRALNPQESLARRLADAALDTRRDELFKMPEITDLADLDNTSNAFEALKDYTRSALHSKMENDVRQAYVQAMRQSQWGGETMRPISKKERGKFKDRQVEFYEGGKKRVYLSSKLQSELLKFDPYVAKFPNMYSMKRLFEQGTTGPLSLTFAPMTMLRDSLAGWVFLPRNMKGANPYDVIAAVPKQIWAKTQLAAIDVLRSNMNIPFLDQQQKSILATQISNSYMNSLYHLANASGGTDASLMRTNIENARGIFSEIARSSTDAVEKIPGMKTMGHPVRALIHGFRNVFDAIQESPRFATFTKNVKAGANPEDVVREVKKLTGDTTRSGRVYSPQGKRIDADAINKGMKSVAPVVGKGIEFLRETTPYFNPMVQGTRRMGNAFIDDPIKTNLRAWTGLGLPAMVIMGWNEMLGEEYNRFAFEERSSRDQAMNLYIGVPGKRPEEGIQIPIPHELLLFNSPWTTALYSMMNGGDTEDVRNMMMHIAGTSLDNSAMVGFPQPGTLMFSAAGQKAPESINPFTWGDDVYQLREDNVGLLPQNVEATVRSMFGAISDTALVSAAAMWEGGPEAFLDEFGNSLTKRTPIVRDLAGTRTPVTNYTPISHEKQAKVDALREFVDMYNEHFDREGRLAKRALPSTKGIIEDDRDESSIYRLGPLPMPTPTNPIVQEYGELIKSVLNGNSEGWDGLVDREMNLRKQIRLLKSYSAGRKDAFKEWQKTYEGADAELQTAGDKPSLDLIERAKADRLVKTHDLDLSKRDDVLSLIGILERERLMLLKEQMKLVDLVEDKMTEDLMMRGMIPKGSRFKVEKHLGPILTP